MVLGSEVAIANDPVQAEEEEEEEEDLIDPHIVLREECNETGTCKKFIEKLEECNSRVNGRSKTEETCTDELFDYIHAVDHCVASKLFDKLK